MINPPTVSEMISKSFCARFSFAGTEPCLTSRFVAFLVSTDALYILKPLRSHGRFEKVITPKDPSGLSRLAWNEVRRSRALKSLPPSNGHGVTELTDNGVDHILSLEPVLMHHQLHS